MRKPSLRRSLLTFSIASALAATGIANASDIIGGGAGGKGANAPAVGSIAPVISVVSTRA